ncbi:MAG: peptidylprolyl isomerase [Clostridia bacterium]|nr:peptidylprolyl isomerase [Clostridia bacterium]MBR3955191.1 peptidylprolyl isomerase [Clostridia bacterium]
MKIKSLIAVFLAAMLCLFAACGASDTENTENSNGDDTMTDLTKYAQTGHPIAVIEMQDGGKIIVELYDDIAPNTVKSFISLANKGFYDGLIFHRVIQGFMIQGGDPLGNGTGGPGYCIPGEFSNNDFNNTISHTRGTISMGRRGSQFADYLYYNTAGCQFFICDADSTFLDGNYASFGRVVEGMDVVDRIAATATNASDKPLEDQVMKSVYVETFGKTYEEPVTLAES